MPTYTVTSFDPATTTSFVDENHRPWEEQRANAVLVQHRYNNFDKALEALKRGIDPRWTIHGDECGSRGPPPYDGEPSDNGCDCWVAHRKQLVKELEEVAT